MKYCITRSWIWAKHQQSVQLMDSNTYAKFDQHWTKNVWTDIQSHFIKSSL